MDQSAIHAIQELAVSEQSNFILHCDEISPAVIIPNNHKLTDLEHLLAAPKRFRAEFKTKLIDEFVSYVNTNGTAKTGIFIDTKDTSATAIINLGNDENPEWGDHKAKLTLTRTPEFAEVIFQNERPLSQQELIDFFEDWQEHIQFLDDAEESFDFRASINAIRRLTVSATQERESTTRNYSASQSSLDAIEVKAAGAVLPYGFLFSCTPYESLQSIVLLCQLRALTDGKDVKLKYRIMMLDSFINKISVEFKDLLKASITIDAGFYTGTMIYQE